MSDGGRGFVEQRSSSGLESTLRGGASIGFWLFGGLAAILMPLILCFIGWFIDLLTKADTIGVPVLLELGEQLRLNSEWIGADQSALRGSVVLVTIILGLLTLQAGLLWLLYRSAVSSAAQEIGQLVRDLSAKSHELATVQGVSGQKSALRSALTEKLPLIESALISVYRSLPRHAIQIIACSILAILIQPWIALLGIVLFVLFYRLYSWIEARNDLSASIEMERFDSARSRLVDLCEDGPLLSMVQSDSVYQENLGSLLRTYQNSSVTGQLLALWKTPFLTLASAVGLSILGILLAIHVIDGERSFSIASAFVLASALLTAAANAVRLAKLSSSITIARRAAGELDHYLKLPVNREAGTDKADVQGIRDRVCLDHVTLRDSSGHKLVEDVSLEARPGQLISIVSSDPLQARAVAELLLGMGKPSSGRLMIDQVLHSDINLNAFQESVVWIGTDGPMVSGSLEENLVFNGRTPSMAIITDAIRQAGIYDAIQNLPDGLATLVTPHDSRFPQDFLFRMGVARALLRRPSLVVADEPSVRVSPSKELETLNSLKQLTNQGALVMVLPQRSATLRASDLVVVLHDHKVIAQGTHVDLLASNDFYRHYNYLRFSTFRDVPLG